MDNNIQNLKNVINDNDFYKNRNNDTINNRRIFDLETFYQKKYSNDYNNANNIFNNNNNYQILENNVNNYQILENNVNNYQIENENIDNNNYFNNNENKKLNEIFANDIEAENNIGKYRQKLLNCSNIVEENYKRFNEFQNNNRYKRLNLKYSQQNYNNKSSIFNDMSKSIKNNDYFYKPIKIGNNLNHNIMNRNFDNNLNNIRNNRLSKSYSTGNIYQNNYYL